MISPLIAWSDIKAYLDETRERVILDLADESDNERRIWKNLGKLALLDELSNLRDILATLDSAKKDV